MSGIYLHIPYCKQACHYCDFHFSTNQKTRPELIQAICKEIGLRKDYLGTQQLATLYFGGGTPSMLSHAELELLFDSINRHFTLKPEVEITLEANPDDLSRGRLSMLKALGINRLSIGIQSFNDKYLRLFNRAHSAAMALRCVAEARSIGFNNISVDLMYGLPEQTLAECRQDLRQITALSTEHISIYGLSIEANTAFGRWESSQKLHALDEESAAQQFELIMAQLGDRGFEQYEIANFCQPGYESKHNSGYWLQQHYLGIGPGAHSFDGKSRQYNVRSNSKYIEAIANGHLFYEKEWLSPAQRINEYILTRIRTSRGVDLEVLKKEMQYDLMHESKAVLDRLQRDNLVRLDRSGHVLTLSTKGRLLADGISQMLMTD